MNDSIWLIGCGTMAVDYSKVLLDMRKIITVIGRGKKSAESFKALTGIDVKLGGLDAFLETAPKLPSCAIVAVGVEELARVTTKLISYGVTRILLEKPGGLNEIELKNLAIEARNRKSEIWVAYNRRYYTSVQKAKEIIAEDGGVTSFFFEFTEWSHIIKTMTKPKVVMNSWFLANSTHVADLAFFLGGFPKEIHSSVSGSLDWHPAGSMFFGNGISESGAGFVYMANWSAPGRWGVEVLTCKSRLIFRPLEQLQIMRIGSVAIEQVPLEDELDKTFKPGLYRQVKAFIDNNRDNACLIENQAEMAPIYMRMAGYK